MMNFYSIAGKKYPRVTHIIQATNPKSEASALKRKQRDYDSEHGEGAWEARVSKRSHEGVALHQTAKSWLEGESEPSYPDDIFSYWFGLRAFLEGLEPFEVLATEQLVVNESWHYAGTCDALIKFKKSGKTCLLDFKTFEGYSTWNGRPQFEWNLWRRSIKGQKRPLYHPGFEWCSPKYRDALLQGCLYKMALDHSGIPVNSFFIVVASRLRRVQLLSLPNYLWEGCQAEAFQRLQQFHQKETSHEEL